MKKMLTTITVALLTIPSLLLAGVQMEMVTTDSSGEVIDRSKFYAQSAMLRVDEIASGDADVSMIYRNDEFLVLNHAEKSYIVMDQAMLDNVSSQVSEAMKQMEAQLANLPPEQRAMAEQMMKGRLQGMMGQEGSGAPKFNVQSSGSGEWQSESCDLYTVYKGAEKAQEVCAADLDDVAGADEAMAAFRGMAAFIEKLTESLPMAAGQTINPGELMDQINGFPVRTRMFEAGVFESEAVLESVSEMSLDAAMFAVPADYRRENPF